MPPKWALGYHQCRWSYMSDKRVAEVSICSYSMYFWIIEYGQFLFIVYNFWASLSCFSSLWWWLQIAQTFRDKKIPSDVIWMDIDYMDGFRCFTFDKVFFLFKSQVDFYLRFSWFTLARFISSRYWHYMEHYFRSVSRILVLWQNIFIITVSKRSGCLTLG